MATVNATIISARVRTRRHQGRARARARGPGLCRLCLFRSRRGRRGPRLCLLRGVRPCCCSSLACVYETVDSLAATALSRAKRAAVAAGGVSGALLLRSARLRRPRGSALLLARVVRVCSLELAARRVFCNTARLAQTQPSRELLLQNYVTGRCSGRLNASTIALTERFVRVPRNARSTKSTH